MPTIAETLAVAAKRLEPVTETPRLDAEYLLAHALDMPRGKLLARLHEPCPTCALESLLERRLEHEPIAYITGTWEFFGIELAVRPPMLVPRPETEHLVEAGLEYCDQYGDKKLRALDLCTGTGCVAIALAKHAPNLDVTATDANPDAIALARENAASNCVKIDFYEGDLFAALPEDEARFDLILSNPPYVAEREWGTLSPVITKHEDPQALLAGPEGLDIIRRIAAEAPAHLNPGGLLALEIGDGQSDAVTALLQAQGYRDVRCVNDLAKIPRIVSAKWEGG